MMTKLYFVEEDGRTVKERKNSTRAYAKAKRAEVDNRDVKEERLIENFYKAFLDKTDGADTGLTFFVYLSFSREAPTDKLIESLLLSGHKVCCPRLQDGEMLAVEYGEDITLSEYGIREPTGEPYAGEIDVAVVPLLAVDIQGNRLGYGGGYYDRFLKKTGAKRVAFCYDCQIMKNVPAEPWDEKMDAIVTETRVVFVKERVTE